MEGPLIPSNWPESQKTLFPSIFEVEMTKSRSNLALPAELRHPDLVAPSHLLPTCLETSFSVSEFLCGIGLVLRFSLHNKSQGWILQTTVMKWFAVIRLCPASLARNTLRVKKELRRHPHATRAGKRTSRVRQTVLLRSVSSGHAQSSPKS